MDKRTAEMDGAGFEAIKLRYASFTPPFQTLWSHRACHTRSYTSLKSSSLIESISLRCLHSSSLRILFVSGIGVSQPSEKKLWPIMQSRSLLSLFSSVNLHFILRVTCLTSDSFTRSTLQTKVGFFYEFDWLTWLKDRFCILVFLSLS